jgi:hypothetical protein
MTTWHVHAIRGLMLAALAVAVPLGAARAGQTRLEPGAADTVDTGERGNYTTMTIRNLGGAPGSVVFGAPIGRTVTVPAGGSVELNGAYGRPGVAARNSGPTSLTITTRYMETVRGP